MTKCIAKNFEQTTRFYDTMLRDPQFIFNRQAHDSLTLHP